MAEQTQRVKRKSAKRKRDDEDKGKVVRIDTSRVPLRPGHPKHYGLAEVAEALDVQPPNLRDIKDLPEPVDAVRATRLWLKDEIDEFAKVYAARRRPRAAQA